jgi:hypothetical protein
MRALILLSVFTIFSAGSALAQGDRGTITGTVSDPQNAVVPEARVTAVHVATNAQRFTTTTSTGSYTLAQLPVGSYRVEVEAAGFKKVVRTEVALNAGMAVRLDVSLEVGTLNDVVNVTSSAPLLQADTAKVTTVVTTKLKEDLPLAVAGAPRSPLDLALITPQVRSVGSDLSVGGGQEEGYSATLDGIDTTANEAGIIYGMLATLNSPSIDAITEFSVDTNGFKAESGRLGGGMISYVTKAGTNSVHGSVYDFFRNEALDANNFFNNATGSAKTKLRQSDFGFTLGGPVYIPKLYNGRNKTFFFASFEGFRNRTVSAVRFLTIPLPAMYKGDFSNWKDSSGNLIPVYDPATTRPDDKGGFARDAFPSNQIPLGRFSQISQNVLKLATMAPNAPDPAGKLNPNPRNNFLSVSPGNPLSAFGGYSNPYDKYSIKIDHQLNDANRLGFLFHRGVALELAPEETSLPALPHPLGDFTNGDTETRVYRLSWDRTISPRVYNQLRTGVNNQIQERGSTSVREGWGTKLGLTKNIPLPDFMFPGLSMDDYTGWGRAFFGNNKNKTFTLLDDLTVVRGSHTLKFGGHYQIDHYNGGGCHTCSGTFSFSRLSTSVPLDQSGRTGNGFASMLLGLVSSGNVTTERYVSNQWSYRAVYAQDDWKIRRNLTLSYGLRWEYTPPTVEGHFPNGYSNFDPNTPNPAAGGRLGASIFAGSGPGRTGRRSLYDGWPWGFGPRLGLAYQIRASSVIRASATRSFAPMKNTGGSAHWDGFVGNYTFSSIDQLITPAFNWDNGFPEWVPPPDLRPQLMNNSTIPFWQSYDGGRLPEYYNLNFDIQQQIPGQFMLEVGYNAVLGHHLTANLVNLNQAPPSVWNALVSQLDVQGATSLMSQNINSPVARAANIPFPWAGFNGPVIQALKPYPQYIGIQTGQDGGDRSGNSTYHALVVQVQRRYSAGLEAQGSYVLSKFLTDSDAAAAATSGVAAAMDQYNRRLEKSVSRRDQTHIFKLNYSYELPFGPGKKFVTDGGFSHLVRGWRVAAIHTYYSGLPLTVLPGYQLPLGAGPNRITVTDYNGWRAGTGGGGFDPFANTWWSVGAFSRTPTVTVPSGVKGGVLNSRFGNATQFNPKARGPWTLNENISIARTFAFTEKLHMDLRWEMFNMLNRVMWGAADSTLTSNNFGLVRSQANLPRQMQFALKFQF